MGILYYFQGRATSHKNQIYFHWNTVKIYIQNHNIETTIKDQSSICDAKLSESGPWRRTY